MLRWCFEVKKCYFVFVILHGRLSLSYFIDEYKYMRLEFVVTRLLAYVCLSVCVFVRARPDPMAADRCVEGSYCVTNCAPACVAEETNCWHLVVVVC